MSLSTKKLNLKEIREQYPAEKFSIAQALVSYLEDTNQLVGAVGNIDSVALLAFFKTLEIGDIERTGIIEWGRIQMIEWDWAKYIEPIKYILRYELADRADLAWEMVEAVLSGEEEESEELIEGTLG